MTSRMMFFIVVVLFSASCTSSKKIAYFQNAQDTTYNPIIGTIEAPIQPNDILDIVISSLDAKASTDFNKVAIADDQIRGYLVNSDGSIDLPDSQKNNLKKILLIQF
jgi:polysaccharide biosynthesis/export protein